MYCQQEEKFCKQWRMPSLFLHLKYQRVSGTHVQKRGKILHVQHIPLGAPNSEASWVPSAYSTFHSILLHNGERTCCNTSFRGWRQRQHESSWTTAPALFFFKTSMQVGSSFENATYYMDISAINGLGKSAKLKGLWVYKSQYRDNWERSGEEEF